jgi:hypothetical protein
MKSLFTIHAGEYLVGSEINRKLRHVNIWLPEKDTGIDLLITNKKNKKTVSLQVKFSRDYLVTHMKGNAFQRGLQACGWWKLNRQKIVKSQAEYWIFVLLGFDNRSKDFVIIKSDDLLKRLDKIHGNSSKFFDLYFWVTKRDKCYEARSLTPTEKLNIADGKFKNRACDFTKYLNNWAPIEVLDD